MSDFTSTSNFNYNMGVINSLVDKINDEFTVELEEKRKRLARILSLKLNIAKKEMNWMEYRSHLHNSVDLEILEQMNEVSDKLNGTINSMNDFIKLQNDAIKIINNAALATLQENIIEDMRKKGYDPHPDDEVVKDIITYWDEKHADEEHAAKERHTVKNGGKRMNRKTRKLFGKTSKSKRYKC